MAGPVWPNKPIPSAIRVGQEAQNHQYMGLTIHYELATTGNEAHSRNLVRQLRQAALDLPFDHVGEIIELRGHRQCDFERLAEDHPHRGLLMDARAYVEIPAAESQKRHGIVHHAYVRPLHVIAFETEPGDGCETASYGLCQYPSVAYHLNYGRFQPELKGWSWASFCKTHYASDPACGGLPSFLRCHLSVVALLDEAEKLGFLGEVSDEGEFWDTRSLKHLTKEVGEQSAELAAFVGALREAVGQASDGASRLEAPIVRYPNFEHLEAEGQRLLPEQLKGMLRALARSNLIRGCNR
jgi:hypothetical protein